MTGHLGAAQAGPPAEAGNGDDTASRPPFPSQGDLYSELNRRPSRRQCAPLLAGVNLVRPRLRLRALQIDPDSSMARGRTQEGRGSLGDPATPILELKGKPHLTRPRSFRDDCRFSWGRRATRSLTRTSGMHASRDESHGACGAPRTDKTLYKKSIPTCANWRGNGAEISCPSPFGLLAEEALADHARSGRSTAAGAEA